MIFDYGCSRVSNMGDVSKSLHIVFTFNKCNESYAFKDAYMILFYALVNIPVFYYC